MRLDGGGWMWPTQGNSNDCMKVEIPENLKADIPPTTWGKMLSATPVVMAVLSTLLAGLASSEMTKAQYSRALAAQQQSKAGDQWNFFQSKRLRGTLQRNTLDLLESTGPAAPLTVAALERLAPGKTDQATLELLAVGKIPDLPPPLVLEPAIQAALDGVEKAEPETDLADQLANIKDTALTAALKAARGRAAAFDVVTGPVSKTLEAMEAALRTKSSEEWASNGRSLTALRLRFATLRYEAEARLNQAIAGIYELQVRKSNLTSERHQRRSVRFFYGMLGTQAAVIVSTLAMAARKRNFLWGLAAGAGLLALAFAIYVYLWV
jgi:hypothetical protein